MGGIILQEICPLDTIEPHDNAAATLDQDAVERMLESKGFAALKSELVRMEIHELADLLGDLDAEPSAVCFRLLPTEISSEIFGELPIELQEAVLDTLSSEKISAILHDMPPDERTELLEELPGRMAQQLLQMLRGTERDIARRLLAYPAESIGRLMTPEYLAVREHWTIDMVLRHIRKKAESRETINVLY
ncbi:MAG TPA: magnesium transporter, partial [Phycisphaerae bacterium]|nr:magnesium transporter [Phycisphaerae bacterium]